MRIMNILIAMDSFKGTLTATQACEIVADTIREKIADAKITIKPMADGGEGTAQAMIKAAGGQWIERTVMGPLPDMTVKAGFAWFKKDRTAVVEMASASGMELLSPEQLNPLKTTTFGTGQLIKAASEYGAKKILLAVGGSATVDGGVGAASALGWQFLDKDGNDVPLGGTGLEKIAEIIEPKDLSLPTVEVLCDVDNPLTGDLGAARIFSQQKGATPEMVEQLENALSHLANLVWDKFGRDIKTIPGAGAAGGLSAGANAFMNASLVSGIDKIIAHSNLAAELQSTDWVITGEGSFDQQSLRGKVVSGILKLALRSDINIAVIAGKVMLTEQEYKELGISVAISCKQDNMSIEYAIGNCQELLKIAVLDFVDHYLS